MPSPRKTAPSPSLRASTSVLKERSMGSYSHSQHSGRPGRHNCTPSPEGGGQRTLLCRRRAVPGVVMAAQQRGVPFVAPLSPPPAACPTLPYPRETEKRRLILGGCAHRRVSYRRKSCRADTGVAWLFVTRCGTRTRRLVAKRNTASA